MAYMNVLKFHSGQLPPMNCRIVLSTGSNGEEKSAFSCGEVISGELHISCQKDIYSFGIRCALEGTAMVKFKEQGAQSKTTSLLEYVTYVYGKGDQRIRLQPGDHVFPFSVELPFLPSLPGSFKSPFGLVLYQIVVYVQLEWKFVRKAEKTISVTNYMNLSMLGDPSLFQPVVYEKSEKTLLPSLISRRLTPQFKFTCKMPHTAYVGGEEIIYELELDNPSTYEIARMSVTLIQKINYIVSYSSVKTKQRIVSRKETSHMDTPNGTFWRDNLHVPYSAKPTLKGIIEISYNIRIEVKSNGHATLRGDIPVVIGTTREPISPSTLSPSATREDQPDGGTAPCVSEEGPSQLKSKRSLRARERSPSPCPLSRARSSGPAPRGQHHHKTLDRADTVATPTAAGGRSHPPRYSLLSVRSSSVETLPPTYEDALDKPPSYRNRSTNVGTKDSSDESDSAVEIQEFQKGNIQGDDNDADDDSFEDDEEGELNVEVDEESGLAEAAGEDNLGEEKNDTQFPTPTAPVESLANDNPNAPN